MNILCTYDDGAGTTFYLIYVIQSKYLFFAAIDLTFLCFAFLASVFEFVALFTQICYVLL